MPAAFLSLALIACMAWIIYSGSYLKWHPFFSLLTAAVGFGLATGLTVEKLLEVITHGFGSLVGTIGLIVIFGCILGVVLEDSGSVQALGNWLARRSKRPSLAIALLGMLLGIPVFCDSGFIILFSLTRSMAQASQTPLPAMSLSLAGGLYSSHTLVPPTPGPVAAAGTIGASIGLVMIWGIIIAVPVTIVSHLFSLYIGKKLTTLDTTQPIRSEGAGSTSADQALILILFPVALIALGSLAELLSWQGYAGRSLTLLGKPVVALFLGTGLALLLSRKTANLTGMIDKALRQAGPIILLTACGGALGAVLRASSLTEVMNSVLGKQLSFGAGFLVAAFLIGAIFKTAQGSTTSAMILTSAFFAPLMPTVGLASPLDLALLVLAIGGGAMTVSHANDSYFWVVTQFTGFTLRDGFRGMTVMTLLQGLTALLTVLLIFMVSR